MTEYFPKQNSLGGNVKVELDLPNYATKTDLKNATGVDTSSFAKKIDLANLKSNADKSYNDKLKNVATNLNNLKSKVDKLDVDKLVPVPVKMLLKRLNITSQLKKFITTDTSNLKQKTQYNTKITEIENKSNDHDHAKYITTQECKKLTAYHFTARLK